MRSLITGGCGFVGRHLANFLVQCGDDVAVTYLPGSDEKDAAETIALPRTAQTIALDVTDEAAVSNLIKLSKPDAIYHLAAQAFVPSAEKSQRQAFEVNSFGVLNVLNAIVSHSRDTRFLCVSSGEVYGEPRPGSLPFTEMTPLRPATVYGITKATADLTTFQYAFKYGIHAVRVRPFPHLGPGQSDKFAMSSFAKQLALIKLGKAESVLRVGNLEAKRDYSDVSDIVRGYYEAMLNGTPGEVYNLCSGKSYEIRELLDKLIAIAGVEVEIIPEQSRMRDIDILEAYGSYERAQREFGWRPRIDLNGTLHSLFAYWVEILSK